MGSLSGIRKGYFGLRDAVGVLGNVYFLSTCLLGRLKLVWGIGRLRPRPSPCVKWDHLSEYSSPINRNGCSNPFFFPAGLLRPLEISIRVCCVLLAMRSGGVSKNYSL